MNNEIKEIKIGMYSTDEILEFMTNGEGRGFLGRSMYDAIIDYITNLQKENERLKEENILLKASEPMSKLAEDYGYKSRCEKANQYIKKNTHEYKMFNEELGHFSNLTNISIDKNNKVFIDDLLKILVGDDE